MTSGELRKGFVWRAIVSFVVAPVVGVGLATATQTWAPEGTWLFIVAFPMSLGFGWFYRWFERTGG